MTYYPIINCNAPCGESASNFSIGSIIMDVYRNQFYEVIKVEKWATLKHLSTGVVEPRSLFDYHFKEAKQVQLELF